MKKLLFLIFLLNSLLIFAEGTTRTGELLFIAPFEPCTVYLDGIDIGDAPLLVQDLSPGNRLLQLKTEYSYAETELQYDATIKSVTKYTPELGKYYGYLSIESNIDNAVISIDDRIYDISDCWYLKLAEGPHLVKNLTEGYISKDINIDIPRLETAQLELNFERAINIEIIPELPHGTSISFTESETGTILEFEDQANIKLGIDEWTAVFRNPVFETVELHVSVKDAPVALDFELNYYHPTLSLSGLTKDSLVYLDGENVTSMVDENKLEVPVGSGDITVFRENYLAITRGYITNGNEMIEIPLEYQLSPDAVHLGKIITGASLMGSGAILLTGGLVFAGNSILAALSPDYDSYKLGKYTAWGSEAAGLALITAGGVITGITLFGEVE